MGLHIDPFGENKQKSIEVEKKNQTIEKPIKKSNDINNLDLLDIDTLLNMNDND
jgi:hypothetical protein